MRNPSAAGKGKTTACCSKIGLKKGPWTPEEDEILSNYINKEGEGRWRTLPKRAGLLRCGKSCRLRWMNYLRPCVKRGHIAPDEEDLILRLHRLLGNRWSLIAGRIPGRTDNEIKNFWNTHLSKKLISQGIDPRTHKPLDPLSVNQFKLASSSSRPINRKSPSLSSPNYQVNKSNHPNTSNSGGTPVISNKENVFSDEMGILRSIDNVNVNVNVEDEDMMNCCGDDVFSSFLDSLINEEPFITAQQQEEEQEQVINGILQASDQPFVSITDGWDYSTFNPHDHGHLHQSNYGKLN